MVLVRIPQGNRPPHGWPVFLFLHGFGDFGGAYVAQTEAAAERSGRRSTSMDEEYSLDHRESEKTRRTRRLTGKTAPVALGQLTITLLRQW